MVKKVFLFAIVLSITNYAQSGVTETEIVGIDFTILRKQYGSTVERNINRISVEADVKSFAALTKMELSHRSRLRSYQLYITSSNKVNRFPLYFVLLDEDMNEILAQPPEYRKGLNTHRIGNTGVAPGMYYFGVRYDLSNADVNRKFTYAFKYTDKSGKKVERQFVGPTLGFFRSRGKSAGYLIENGEKTLREDVDISHSLELRTAVSE
ncbi:MAG: hypothetical protein EAS48_00120 [Chryseobacterium sp.]|nr:MAG: hypothetical protein EAS48_00120 [Chryseobacterium sp.]